MDTRHKKGKSPTVTQQHVRITSQRKKDTQGKKNRERLGVASV